MKLELKKFGIYLIPENYADKMYIARFIKEENNKFGNIEASYISETWRGGNGHINHDNLVENEDDLNDNSITINEISGLTILPTKI
jgi:hypothetical protein